MLIVNILLPQLLLLEVWLGLFKNNHFIAWVDKISRQQSKCYYNHAYNILIWKLGYH